MDDTSCEEGARGEGSCLIGDEGSRFGNSGYIDMVVFEGGNLSSLEELLQGKSSIIGVGPPRNMSTLS